MDEIQRNISVSLENEELNITHQLPLHKVKYTF